MSDAMPCHIGRGLLALSLWLMSAGSAAAQGFATERLRPAAAQSTAYVGLGSTRLLPAGRWEAGALTHHDSDPLVLRRRSGEVIARVVDARTTLDALLAVGIADGLQLDLNVPIVLAQRGEPVPTVSDGIDEAGLGDIRLTPRLGLNAARRYSAVPGLVLAIDVALPTGDRSTFRGEGLRVEPSLTFEWLPPDLAVAFSVGYGIRDAAQVLFVDIDDELTWSAALAVPIGPAEAIFEVAGAVGVLAAPVQAEEIPAEMLLGVRMPWGPTQVLLAGGVGVNPVAGAPATRLALGVTAPFGDDETYDYTGGAR